MKLKNDFLFKASFFSLAIVFAFGFLLAASADDTKTYYLDSDGDGYGNPNISTTTTESSLAGYVLNNTDCNDEDPLINPGATELCDGTDNNCNGEIDEGVKNTFYLDGDGDSYGQTDKIIEACSMPEGYAVFKDDCNDENSNVHPGVTEVYNLIDDNCNGQIDEGLILKTFYRDSDDDGYGNPNISTTTVEAPLGYVLDNTDCNDADASVNPGAIEICDGKDNNCNGQVDEGVKKIFYFDGDGDGFGDSSKTTLACSAPSNYVLKHGDCNDSNNTVYPGAPELEDNLDNNCDGRVDEDIDEEENEEDDEEEEKNENKKKNVYKNQYGEFKNFGQFVKSMAHETNTLKKEGKITGKEKGKIMSSLKRK